MSDPKIIFTINQYENCAYLDLTVDHYFPVHIYRLEALSRLEGRLREVLANMTVR